MNVLPEQLYRSVTRAPDAEAVVTGATRTSYASLWADIMAFAHFLVRERMPSGTRVALLMNNSPAYVAAYYGTWFAGGVVVALNAAARANDLLNWLEHCGAEWLVVDSTHPEGAAVLAQSSGKRRVVVTGRSAPGVDGVAWESICRDREAQEPPRALPRPEELAAIIYTSGTTGRPKGVMLSHGNLAANTQSILAYLPIRPASRIVNILPFYYAYGNSVMHTHLAAGGCLVLEDNLVYPHRVIERIAAERADGFAGVPATYGVLLGRVRLEEYDLSSLTYVTVAGGAMNPTDIKRLVEKLPRAEVFVMYGQTEATSRLTYLPPERLQGKLGSCGIPIPDVEIEVRAEDGRAARVGVVGEVWVRGPNVMQGYWNDVEATREVVRGGWLRTGDMGARDADGYLYLEGRRNDMIKTGAHRVHPREIEEVIAQIEGVAEVAVIGVDDEVLGQVIKAVIRTEPGSSVDAMRLKGHCRNRLASYKIPKYVEFVQELPKTASGKIQRYLLAGSGGK